MTNWWARHIIDTLLTVLNCTCRRETLLVREGGGERWCERERGVEREGERGWRERGREREGEERERGVEREGGGKRERAGGREREREGGEAETEAELLHTC